MPPCRIITDQAVLDHDYDHLQKGDVIVGRLRLKRGEEHVLLDLQARGVHMIPAPLSQLLSRSKVAQARLLGSFMVPHTRPVYDHHDLLAAVTAYGRLPSGPVICKLDQANGGQGIFLFRSVEDVWNQSQLGSLDFPFVLQPFVEAATDIRVVLLDQTVVSYRRHNPGNFRHNLHCGGQATPHTLANEDLALCYRIMKRAGFPYAFLDLLLDKNGTAFLSEINLRGGLRGAPIDQAHYLQAIETIHQQLLRRHLAGLHHQET